MKQHSAEQIVGLKGYLDTQVGETFQDYELNGLSVKFRTIHMPDGVKPFPYAIAAAVVGEGSEAQYEIAVSDDVPQDLQGLWAWHELHDFAVLGHSAEHRCLNSEKAALQQLIENQSDLLPAYLQTRTEFYGHLADFMAAEVERQGGQSPYDSHDVQGAIDAKEYLESLKN